jgi:hypothetical protein
MKINAEMSALPRSCSGVPVPFYYSGLDLSSRQYCRTPELIKKSRHLGEVAASV